MTAQKKEQSTKKEQTTAAEGVPQGKPEPPAPATGSQAKKERKAWVPKTPVEVVLEQITRQEKKVGELREELKKEEGTLNRLQQAKKVLEAS